LLGKFLKKLRKKPGMKKLFGSLIVVLAVFAAAQAVVPDQPYMEVALAVNAGIAAAEGGR
jgi:hypothetical protein